MPKRKPKLVKALSPTGTGTPFGIGFWAPWVECPRMGALNELHKKATGLCGSKGRDVGTLSHALVDHFIKHGKVPRELAPIGNFPKDYREAIWAEAQRMYRAWRGDCDARGSLTKTYGKIVGSETSFEIKNFLGFVPIYTGQFDLEVIVAARKRRIIDWKFMKSATPKGYYLHDVRILAYMQAYETLHPRRTLDGMELHEWIKTGRPRCVKHFVSAQRLDSGGRKKVQAFFKMAVAARDAWLDRGGLDPSDAPANPLACWPVAFLPKCPHLGKRCFGF